MNRYTVRKATCGAANALKARYAGSKTPLRAVIAYDSRNHSEEFAAEAAGTTRSNFVDFSAVTSGIKEIKTVMAQAEANRGSAATYSSSSLLYFGFS